MPRAKTPSFDIRRTTLKDVARAAGVTLPTASKIMAGKADSMAEATIERVKACAQQLGYRSHFAAKLLNRRSTGIVGIVFANPEVGAEDQNRILALRLATRLQREGRSVFIQSLGVDPVEDVLDLINRGCEAFVFIMLPAFADRLEKALADNGSAWLCVKGDMSRRIGSSYASGIQQLLEAWVREGRTFRLLIDVDDPADTARWEYRHRYLGLKGLFPGVADRELFRRHVRTMHDSGDAETVVQNGFEATRRVLAEEPGVDALFYSTDLHALGGLRHLVERGTPPGPRMRIAGSNNLELVSRFGPWPFPSVGMDFDAIESAVVEKLFGREPIAIDIPPRVHLR